MKLDPEELKLLCVEDVAKITGWKVSTVRAKILRREVDYVKLGRSVRIPMSAIEKLVSAGFVPAREATR